VVADHQRAGAVVWVGEGKSGATLERFYDTLGLDRTPRLTAVSMDLHGACVKVTRARAPHAQVCADPFHVIKLANAAVDEVRRGRLEHHPPRRWRRPPRPVGRVRSDPAAQLGKHTRWALLNDPASWTDHQRQTITQLRRARHVLFRAWALKEELRDHLYPAGRRPDVHLDAWLAHASRSRIPAILALSRTIAVLRQAPRSVELGLSNSKLEGLTSKSGSSTTAATATTAPPRFAMIYLCCRARASSRAVSPAARSAVLSAAARCGASGWKAPALQGAQMRRWKVPTATPAWLANSALASPAAWPWAAGAVVLACEGVVVEALQAAAVRAMVATAMAAGTQEDRAWRQRCWDETSCTRAPCSMLRRHARPFRACRQYPGPGAVGETARPVVRGWATGRQCRRPAAGPGAGG
jgi:hypothetical protein